MALLEGYKVSKGLCNRLVHICKTKPACTHRTALGHTLAFVGLDVAVTWKQSETDSNVLMLFALTFGSY
jgi:hypothetical protein